MPRFFATVHQTPSCEAISTQTEDGTNALSVKLPFHMSTSSTSVPVVIGRCLLLIVLLLSILKSQLMWTDSVIDQTCQCVKELNTHLRVFGSGQVLGSRICATCGVSLSPALVVFVQSIPLFVYVRILRNSPPKDISSFNDFKNPRTTCSVCQAGFQYEHVFCICCDCYRVLFAPYCPSSLNTKLNKGDLS